MTPEGHIAIEVTPTSSGPKVNIASSRPLAIPTKFAGLRPSAALLLVRSLFATCKAAQGAAAVSSFEAAMGRAPGREALCARRVLVLAETVREHALRVLLEWPKALGEGDNSAEIKTAKALMEAGQALARAVDPHGEAFVVGGDATVDWPAARAAASRLLTALDDSIFGEDSAAFTGRATLADLAAWAAVEQTPAQRLIGFLLAEGFGHFGSVPLSPLPALDDATLLSRLFGEGAAAFIAAPDWQGIPRETTPLARHHHHPMILALRGPAGGYGIAARLAACLIALAEAAGELSDIVGGACDPVPPSAGKGPGLAVVEAARGRLIHAVQMDGEVIKAYRILAPTEWNFHPEGAAAAGLSHIASEAGAARERLAHLFLVAMDPCVSATVRFTDA